MVLARSRVTVCSAVGPSGTTTLLSAWNWVTSEPDTPNGRELLLILLEAPDMARHEANISAVDVSSPSGLVTVKYSGMVWHGMVW